LPAIDAIFIIFITLPMILRCRPASDAADAMHHLQKERSEAAEQARDAAERRASLLSVR